MSLVFSFICYKKIFNYDKFCTASDFITELIMFDGNRRAQIINFVLEEVDEVSDVNLPDLIDCNGEIEIKDLGRKQVRK